MKKIFKLLLILIIVLGCNRRYTAVLIKYTNESVQSMNGNYSMIITTDYDTLIMHNGLHIKQRIPGSHLSGIFKEFVSDSLKFMTTVIDGRFTGLFERYFYKSSRISQKGIFLNGNVIKFEFYNNKGEVIRAGEASNPKSSLITFW